MEFENTTFEDLNFTNSFSSSRSFSEYADFPYYLKVTTMVFFVVIMCLGVTGNVMVAIVILKTKDMRNSMHIFLMNLSIADLMVLLGRMPFELMKIASNSNAWVLGKEMCLAKRFLWMMSMHASVFTILAVCSERYYAICKPFKAGYVCTNTRAVVICTLVWFFAALNTSPLLGLTNLTYKHHDGVDVPVCATFTRTFWNKMFFIVAITEMFFIPFAVLIVLCSIIAKNLKENTEFMAQNSNNKKNSNNVLKYRKQVTIMLGAVVLSFCVCLLPIEVLLIYIITVPAKTLTYFSKNGFYECLFFSKTMLFLHPVINPILYNLFSSKFREGFVQLLRLNKLRCRISC